MSIYFQGHSNVFVSEDLASGAAVSAEFGTCPSKLVIKAGSAQAKDRTYTVFAGKLRDGEPFTTIVHAMPGSAVTQVTESEVHIAFGKWIDETFAIEAAKAAEIEAAKAKAASS